jgi:glycosyltransferase involved in cell wall biosynthesis
MRALLIGPDTVGGEGAYMSFLRSNPPTNVHYSSVGGFHVGGPGARCDAAVEVALNRVVRRATIPDMGFRALRLRERFDFVHVHAHPVRLARLRGTPVVMSEGSSSAVYLGDYLNWDEARLERAYRTSRRIYRALGIRDRLLAMDGVARIYVFSDWARGVNLRWGADPDKLDIVEPGFPTPDAAGRTESDNFSFLFVGTDFERKGGFDVVEAFDRIVGDHPSARLTLVGSDPREPNPDRRHHSWVSERRRTDVLAALARLERAGVARHEPLVSAERLQNSLYPSADVFVMPTLAEGFGFTNVEAMSHGLAVLSSRVGPIPETVDERTGLLVSPGDVDAIAQAMSRLASDPGLVRSMGDEGRKAFLGRFTIDRFRQRLADFYRRSVGA